MFVGYFERMEEQYGAYIQQRALALFFGSFLSHDGICADERICAFSRGASAGQREQWSTSGICTRKSGGRR
jgi:hypothetical protein